MVALVPRAAVQPLISCRLTWQLMSVMSAILLLATAGCGGGGSGSASRGSLPEYPTCREYADATTDDRKAYWGANLSGVTDDDLAYLANEPAFDDLASGAGAARMSCNMGDASAYLALRLLQERESSAASSHSESTSPAVEPQPEPETGGEADTQIESASVALASQCGKPGVQRPDEIVLTCADAGLRVEQLRWSRWGGPVAVARGVQMAKDCDPDCASGRLQATPATVRFIKPRRCPGSTEMYYRSATLIAQDGSRSSYELGDQQSGCPG